MSINSINYCTIYQQVGECFSKGLTLTVKSNYQNTTDWTELLWYIHTWILQKMKCSTFGYLGPLSTKNAALYTNNAGILTIPLLQKLSTLVLGIPKALSTWVPKKDFHKMWERQRGHGSTIVIDLDLSTWIEPAMLVIFRTFHYLSCEVEQKIQQQLEWGRLYYDGSHGINQVVYKSSLIFLLLGEYRSAMHFDG